jgi:AAA family ATP:ADP antiporter
LSAPVIYKTKAAVDTFFVRTGDGLAALTILVGTQIISLSLSHFMMLNVILTLVWIVVAVMVVRENRRLLLTGSLEDNLKITRTFQGIK